MSQRMTPRQMWQGILFFLSVSIAVDGPLLCLGHGVAAVVDEAGSVAVSLWVNGSIHLFTYWLDKTMEPLIPPPPLSLCVDIIN